MAYTKYSLTPASNNAAPPDGAPEGMLPSAVNDTMRDMMAQIRDCGDGIRGGTYTMTAPVITGGSVSGVTFSSSAATITGGSVSGITDLAVADGGTGASTVAAAQTNLQVFNFKNRIINGDMRIDQRNAGAAWGTSINGYTVDRWGCYVSATGKLNGGQNYNSITPPTSFTNYAGFQSQSAYSIGSGDYFIYIQCIEGLNMADLAWGSANAKTITLSFWVRSSLTGTFGGSLKNSAGNRSYPYSYTISAANTWEQKSITIAGDTSGTWLTTNGIGAVVTFGLGVGSTGSGTAGAWSASNLNSATGATSVVGTNTATFYVTGVQFEVGSSASNFEYVDITTQLAMCQRYFVKTNPDNASRSGGSWGSFYNTTGAALTGNLPVTMRSAPTFARGGTSDTFYASGITATSTGSSTLFTSTTSWYSYEATALSVSPIGNPIIYNGQASLSAEL